MEKDNVKKIVREAYGKIAQSQSGCGCGCGDNETQAKEYVRTIGYSEKELENIPSGANLGLSCGNPTAMASLKAGETVLDLGSGAGFDCFLAASRVGPEGKVIGVDMTPEMTAKAKDNAKKHNVKNVDFRPGEIEHLPVADSSVDVIISNCVINLSPEKQNVFKEVRRVLKPSGRIAISDIALKKELPEKILNNIESYVGCVSGAVLIDEYKKIVEAAGFKNVKITINATSGCAGSDTKDPIGKAISDSFGENESIEESIASIYVEGYK